MAEQSREKNPNWRGGRSITQQGYVLVRVGTEHHLADVRGYAYEHRLVAEKKLGRRLRRGEQVHHKNGDPADNSEENLNVCSSIAHHQQEHRAPGSKLRRVGQRNPMVCCECRCGERFRRFDASGRPRRFIPGHNPHCSPTKDKTLAAMARGVTSRVEIAKAIGCSIQAVAVCLSKLKRQGLASNPKRGVWKRG